MLIGVYNACLGDKPLGEALDMIASLGMTSVEINSGGFLPPIHLPVDELRASEDARQEYLGEFSSRGLTLTALNCNGNPLFPRTASPTRRTSYDSIELASLLGVKRVITMSGTPAVSPGGTCPCGTRCRGGAPSSTCRTTSGASPSPTGRTSRPARRPRTSRSPSRCTPATSSSTRARCTASSRRPTRRTSAPRWTPATSSGRASTRCSPSPTSVSSSTSPPPRTPASTRPPRSTASSTTALPRRRGRAGLPPARWRLDAQRLAEEPLVGLRRRRPRSRHGLLDRVPARPAQGRPRHARQHRARGPGARPDGGAALRRQHPARGREGDVSPGRGRRATAHRHPRRGPHRASQHRRAGCGHGAPPRGRGRSRRGRAGSSRPSTGSSASTSRMRPSSTTPRSRSSTTRCPTRCMASGASARPRPASTCCRRSPPR